jgi:hypothetical protein
MKIEFDDKLISEINLKYVFIKRNIMKYTEEQKKQLKNKGKEMFTKYDRPYPSVLIKDGFYILESKIN